MSAENRRKYRKLDSVIQINEDLSFNEEYNKKNIELPTRKEKIGIRVTLIL